MRGAWIEMTTCALSKRGFYRRSPCGERGLKLTNVRPYSLSHGSLPVRGAWIEMGKSLTSSAFPTMSLPVRGAWIEIPPARHPHPSPHKSLPVRGAWIEIIFHSFSTTLAMSLPVRGAWIEIFPFLDLLHHVKVAPRAGSVD